METLIRISSDETEWIMDSTIRKDFNRALKRGWVQQAVYMYDDGTIAGMVLKAPRAAISIGKAARPKRVLSKEHKEKLLQSKQVD
jgi:hypothetical protein